MKVAKQCACGASYTLAEFLALPFPASGREFGSGLRFRNCACGSTLALPSGRVTTPMACGAFLKTFAIRERLTHYRDCDAPECRASWADWMRLRELLTEDSL